PGPVRVVPPGHWSAARGLVLAMGADGASRIALLPGHDCRGEISLAHRRTTPPDSKRPAWVGGEPRRGDALGDLHVRVSACRPRAGVIGDRTAVGESRYGVRARPAVHGDRGSVLFLRLRSGRRGATSPAGWGRGRFDRQRLDWKGCRCGAGAFGERAM